MPELGPYGSVRGARGNSRPYRESGWQRVLTARPYKSDSGAEGNGFGTIRQNRSKCSDDLFGSQLSVCLGSKIIRRYDAKYCSALRGRTGAPNGSYRRPPLARFALIGHN